MLVHLLADAVVIVHAAFVAFVAFGGFLALRWRRLAWLHVPAALWGAWIEFAGWTCPLTPLENTLRQWAGEAGYAGGFVEHYLVPVLYPAAYTVRLRLALAALVVGLNALAYALYFRRPSSNRSML
jgi:hypothetical protein